MTPIKINTKSNQTNEIALQDAGIQINLKSWLDALEDGDETQIQAARALFKYDVYKRHAHDYDTIVPYVEHLISNKAFAA